MEAKKSEPFYPIHPGEIIKDELECRGISQRQLAQKMGLSYSVFNEILNGKRPVSSEVAMLVEAALNISAETLLKMQMRYNLQIAKRKPFVYQQVGRNQKGLCASLTLCLKNQ